MSSSRFDEPFGFYSYIDLVYMKRRSRGIIVNLAIFLFALFLILSLNRSQPTKRSFAWNAIQYRTTSTVLPESHGICPGLKDSSKPALVVARVSTDDSEWLDVLSAEYHTCVYTADAPADKSSKHLQVPANRGHEAMAYLTFLIDNYAEIPEAGAVFVHGSRWSWHNDHPTYDNRALLAALNISSALAPFGYHNLRCDWSSSTCPPDTPPQGSVETATRAMLEPFNMRVVSDRALPRAFAALFGGDASGRADAVRAQCCAQFVVSRENVWQHSRDEYMALRQWLLDSSKNGKGKAPNAAPSNDLVAGRILSYTWHILFLRTELVEEKVSSPGHVDLQRLNSLACPRADECYCRLYGRCNLEGCLYPGRCSGQYRLPPNFKLPDDWSATHG